MLFRSHDECPAEAAAVIDAGLAAYNDAAAPLHEVRPVSCVARAADGSVLGGAIGRRGDVPDFGREDDRAPADL